MKQSNFQKFCQNHWTLLCRYSKNIRYIRVPWSGNAHVTYESKKKDRAWNHILMVGEWEAPRRRWLLLTVVSITVVICVLTLIQSLSIICNYTTGSTPNSQRRCYVFLKPAEMNPDMHVGLQPNLAAWVCLGKSPCRARQSTPARLCSLVMYVRLLHLPLSAGQE